MLYQFVFLFKAAKLAEDIEQNLDKIYILDILSYFYYFNVLSNSQTLSILYKIQSRRFSQFTNWFLIKLNHMLLTDCGCPA
jgi:hypothetical protein